MRTYALALLLAAGLSFLVSWAPSQSATTTFIPHSGQLALSQTSDVERTLLQGLATTQTIAGPGLIDTTPSGQVTDVLWIPGGFNQVLDWTITVINFGDISVDITTPSGTKTIEPGESWSATSLPSQNNQFSYTASGNGAENLRFAWTMRRTN